MMRTAELRFGQPYAVVAVTTDPDRRGELPVTSPWWGLPVYSAWITQPEDADEPASPAQARRWARNPQADARNSPASRTESVPRT
ncbi:MAG: hypothetical protein ACXVW7_13035 [Trebonia sp.]